MFKRNQISTAILATALSLSAITAFAQEQETASASVSVQNAFNLAQDSALNFGTLRVTQEVSGGLTTGASVTINADGSAPTTVDSTGGVPGEDSGTISVIDPGVAALFIIDSAAPNTSMVITSIASVALTSTATTSAFILDFVLTDDAIVVGGPNDGNAYTGFNLVTDAVGAVSFNLGGTLSTEIDEDDYVDTTYSGDYIVEVSY